MLWLIVRKSHRELWIRHRNCESRVLRQKEREECKSAYCEEHHLIDMAFDKFSKVRKRLPEKKRSTAIWETTATTGLVWRLRTARLNHFLGMVLNPAGRCCVGSGRNRARRWMPPAWSSDRINRSDKKHCLSPMLRLWNSAIIFKVFYIRLSEFNNIL